MSFNIAKFLFGWLTPERKKVSAPDGGVEAFNVAYSDAVAQWMRKHGRNHALTVPKIVWVDKTRWTRDDKGKRMEIGGWVLTPVSFAMWVGQYPLRGSIAHEIMHCFDLQVFGKTSEESVR